MIEDTPDSVLTDEDKSNLARLRLEVALTDDARIKILRGAAIRGGLAAENLNNLKSKSGAPFVEDEVWNEYKLAFTFMDRREDSFITEFAYLCASKYELTQGKDFKKNSCGWGKGEPKEKKYNNLGPMSGSAGERVYCMICHKELCKLERVVS